MKKTQDILQSLKTGGRRTTLLRKNLVHLFTLKDIPLSLEDIQAELARLKVKPHRVSLYRELEFLKDSGVIEPITIEQGKVRYELADEFRDFDHHHHLICMKCKNISDVAMNDHDLLEAAERESKKQKFMLVKHSLEFFGICADCR